MRFPFLGADTALERHRHLRSDDPPHRAFDRLSSINGNMLLTTPIA
jgi:hypothetical protein